MHRAAFRRTRKKLAAVARALTGGPTDDGSPNLASQLEAVGAPAHLVAQAEDAPEQADIEVLACNVSAVDVFMRCQMRYVSGAGGAACTGIAAEEIGTVLRLRSTPRAACAQLLDDVLLMGREAARVVNDKLKREANRT